MASTVYGLGAGDWEPQPNFTASRDAEGKYTATMSFLMIIGTWEAIASQVFVRGALITSLFTNLGSYWNFLLLENWDVARSEGGKVEVSCSFTGFNDKEWESEREVTYVLGGTRTERSILHHPLYQHQMVVKRWLDHRAIASAVLTGTWAEDTLISTNRDDDKTLELYHVPSQGVRANHVLSTELAVGWFDFIITCGNLTYKAPTLTWTVETSNAGGLTGKEIERLGMTERIPPGNPPQPFQSSWSWMKVTLTDTRTQGASSHSQTWELSPPGGHLQLMGQGDKSYTLYDYELTDIDDFSKVRIGRGLD